jgi:hypothetical protein
MHCQPAQPESNAEVAALHRSVPLVPGRGDFIESMPNCSQGRGIPHTGVCCHRPRCSDHGVARVGPTTPTHPPGLLLVLYRLNRLSCRRTLFAAERLSPSACERILRPPRVIPGEDARGAAVGGQPGRRSPPRALSYSLVCPTPKTPLCGNSTRRSKDKQCNKLRQAMPRSAHPGLDKTGG